MAPGDTLRVGQNLVVWNKPSAGPVRPGSRVQRRITYQVRKGDSLSRIADRFSVTVSNLRRWNSLPRGRYLQPGQRLKLYVDVTSQSGA
jgi:membrane-bound lytic murein transglycosylase D